MFDEKIRNKIESLKMNRKGIYAIDLLVSAVLGIMVLVLVVVLILIILGNMQSNTTLAPVNSAAYNSLGTASTAVSQVPQWFSIIIIVVIAVGLVALVLFLKQAAGSRN